MVQKNDDLAQFGMTAWDGMDAKDEPRQTNRIFMLLRGRYHWAIVLAAIFGIAGGMAGYFRKGHEFQSRAQIQIPQSRDVLLYNDVDTPFQISTFDAYMEAQVQLIQSPQVLNEALVDPRFERQFGKLPRQQALQVFDKDLLVLHPRKQEVINFSFVAGTPEKAQAGVQSVLDAYLAYTQRRDERRDSDKISQIRNIRQTQQNRISRLQQEKSFLISEYGTETTLIVEHDNLRKNIQTIKDELRELQAKIKSFVPSYDVDAEDKDDQLPDEGTMASDAIVAQLAQTDPRIRTLLNQKELLESRLHMFDTRGIGAGHTEVRNTKAELQAVKRQIDQYVLSGSGLALDGAGVPQSPLKQLRAREQALEDEISDKDASALTLAERINKIAQINEEIGETKDDLTFSTTRLERLEVEQPVEQTVHVLNSGDFPLEPYNTVKRVQFGIIGFGGGAGFGVGIVLLIGLADRRLRHVEDAQVGFKDIRMLGVLPTLPTELADPEQAAIASHAVHHIRTLLQIASNPDKDQGIAYAITGPAAGSGKTSMSVALGLSFAATGSKTLLIDCDLVAGGLTRRLDAHVNRSIAEILFTQEIITEQHVHEVQLATRNRDISEKQFIIDRGIATEEQVAQAIAMQSETSVGILDACSGLNVRDAAGPTDIDNLFVLPIGDAKPHHAGQLSPVELSKLVQQAKRYYDVILIDTGPVLGSLEASIMAAAVDNVIMVVSRGDQKSLTTKSFEHLYTLKAQIAGVVFNHALSEDMQKTSYATMSAAQSRISHDYKPSSVFTQQQSERFGPLASAVASYGTVKSKRPA
ncbi:Tyrosine-protein kinase CpsD [Poriferisphaera corsica]|uniref:Tyrosine-protein kinase CpsD n=1 Tax=Poriferisphaera corsica TaxID=2528020 RepID=A0A517YWD6_9BACT|nr:AAA family ATPase [Poriferisphaera corsica]QDU34534.1 Tyrosine-protein kinase CpsD [Poriferisphaera corsica]